MNRLRKLLIKAKLMKGKPHEKAELGKGTWGRRPDDPKMSAFTQPKASISARVIRKDGTIEDLGIITDGGGKNEV